MRNAGTFIVLAPPAIEQRQQAVENGIVGEIERGDGGNIGGNAHLLTPGRSSVGHYNVDELGGQKQRSKRDPWHQNRP